RAPPPRLMMNKSLRALGPESSRKTFYGFRAVGPIRSSGPGRCEFGTVVRRQQDVPKKSRRFRRPLKLITGRRQTEWTGATRCPNEDDPSHNRESLIDRKRTVFFRLRLPCRPLAEFWN